MEWILPKRRGSSSVFSSALRGKRNKTWTSLGPHESPFMSKILLSSTLDEEALIVEPVALPHGVV